MTDYQAPQPYQSYPPVQQSSTMAIVSLISGIVCWFALPVIGAIVAVITGHMAKNEIRNSAGRLSGGGMATAGLILGYVHLALVVLSICGVLFVWLGGCALIGLSDPSFWQ